MNEIVIHNENGLCIDNFKVDKIRNQDMFDIDREKFYIEFKRLVDTQKKIIEMKKNTIKLIKKNETFFKDYFHNEIK